MCGQRTSNTSANFAEINVPLEYGKEKEKGWKEKEAVIFSTELRKAIQH